MDGPLNNPLAELGHISLVAKQFSQTFSQSMAHLSDAMVRLAKGVEQTDANLQHGAEVFAPIVAELTGEVKRLRLEIEKGAKATGRSAWALVFVTLALVLATLVMAWPMWFPKHYRQASAHPAFARSRKTTTGLAIQSVALSHGAS